MWPASAPLRSSRKSRLPIRNCSKTAAASYRPARRRLSTLISRPWANGFRFPSIASPRDILSLCSTTSPQRIRLMESLEHHARAAEAANESKSRFLANVSHELRTPMNAILGMIDVALPKAADPLIQDCLQTAKGSADLLLTLLNDLLDSAKIESGKLELEAAPFSLRRMLDQLTRVLRSGQARKNWR